jgi:NADH-quinone oxidoreductase subunit G
LFDTSSPAAYRFNATIAGIEAAAAILLVGTNPRWEAPLVNTRIRKAVKAGATVFRIGPEVDLTYKVTELGNDLSLLAKLPKELKLAFAGKEKTAFIIGTGALVHDGAYDSAWAAAAGLGATLNVLHTAASRVGALDIGFVAQGGLPAIRAAAGSLKALFLLGADEMDTDAFADTFTIYIGTHGDRGVRHADVILPGAAYTEKHGIYVNLEGRVQYSEMAVNPPGEAREDWTILRALSDALGKTLKFDDLGQLRAAIDAEYSHLTVPGLTAFVATQSRIKTPRVSGEIRYPIEDFYLTNPIARSSPTLQRCSAEILHGQTFAEAAE